MTKPLPASVDETLALLGNGDYVAERSLATALYLALKLKRPLFLEGEAGVGKTEIAKVLATTLGRRLIRLQCYEGLDVASAVYEWNYARQMIEIRLAEATGDRSRESLGSDIFSAGVPDQAAAAAGARPEPRRAAGAADRRARPHRRAVRGLPAGGAVRFPDHDPGARHDQGRAPADRRHHLQPHARDPRRAEAALLLPLGRLSRTPRASWRSCGSRRPACRSGCRSRSSGSCRGCAGWICSSCPASPRRSTGQRR